MWLPARLERSTLGDLLGSLHRGRATGALELVEVDGSAAGSLRAIHLLEGVVVRVDAPGPRIGERVVREAAGRVPVEQALGSRAMNGSERGGREPASRAEDGRLAGHVLMAAGLVSAGTLRDELVAQARERIERLFAMKRAHLRFRVARATPASGPSIALGPEAFLHGRPRKAARAVAAPPLRDQGPGAALALLGIGPDEAATTDAIRRAFRRRAAALHPDRARDATSRRVLERAFAQLGDAYRRALDAAS